MTGRERQLLHDLVAAVPEGELRGQLEVELAEGLRRSYSLIQILFGFDVEGFFGLLGYLLVELHGPPASRVNLTAEERDGLRRLIDERRRQKLGLSGSGCDTRVRDAVRELLAEEPQTCAALARVLPAPDSRIRGALRSLQASGEIEVGGHERGVGVWTLTDAGRESAPS